MEMELGFQQIHNHQDVFECIRFELTHALIEHLMRGGQYNDYSPIYYKTLERMKKTLYLPKTYYPGATTIEVFDKRDNFENCMYLGLACQDASVNPTQLWTRRDTYMVTYNPNHFGKFPAFQVYFTHSLKNYGKIFDSYQMIGQF